MTVSRRDVLTTLLSGAAFGSATPAMARAGHGRTRPRAPVSELTLGPPAVFSFDGLDDRARALAKAPYQPKAATWADSLNALDFDAIGQIAYRHDAALWPGDKTIGPVEFFHLGRYARTPVTIHVVSSGEAREILYRQSLFDVPADSPAARLPADLGFAGFRVMNPSADGDWIAYLGASYFRAADPFNQYGLSVRGLALDTAIDGPEEFPVFTAFWLEHNADGLVVSALLESASVVGAYRIGHRRDATGLVQSIESRLHFRAAVKRLGVAPLTSMFWYGQGDHAHAADWRPQIHDSDGLSL